MLKICVLLAGLAVPQALVHAAAAACRTSSDYDVTVTGSALQFQRKGAHSPVIEMQRGALTVDRQPLALAADDRKRVADFETKVRELVPKIKLLGQRGVDLMVAAIRDEAAKASPQSAASPELNARVDARAKDLKLRIAASRTSKEWHPDALAGYMTAVLG